MQLAVGTLDSNCDTLERYVNKITLNLNTQLNEDKTTIRLSEHAYTISRPRL
jgi:hypothetical protein